MTHFKTFVERRTTMKRWTVVLPAILAATALVLGGCGGGGSSGNDPITQQPPPPPPPAPTATDRDGDGIPNGDDAFPDDPARFGNYAPVLLQRVGGTFGAAVAINDSNLVVGLSDDGTGSVKAVKWTVNGALAGPPVVLEPLPQNGYSAAYGVGADGTVVGESEEALDFVAVVWPGAQTVPAKLGLGSLRAPSAAYGIAGSRIVGEATHGPTDAPVQVAVVWNAADAAPTALSGIGGDSSSAYFASGGLVVGEATSSSGAGRGVVWTLNAAGAETGAPIELAPLAGHVSSIALAVNTTGEVVGESQSASGEVHAVVWTLDGSVASAPLDLGVGSASAVNELDRVAGFRGAPNQPSLWDLRNSGLPESIGAFGFGHVYGMNAGAVLVGLADDQGFVAIPQ
jgi:probable HAF family extracellular repeat protein